jgi:hypothetical protein
MTTTSPTNDENCLIPPTPPLEKGGGDLKCFPDGAPRASPWYHWKRPFGANILHQRTNSPTGKPVVLLVLG